MPPKKKKKKKNKSKKIDLIKLDQEKNNKDVIDVPPFRIVNVVSTCSLGIQKLDLRSIALKYNFLEFNPLCFAAATMRIREPRTTALLFASGNMVVTGASNERLSRLAARKYCRVLQKCGLRVYFKKFGIQNIVASANVGFTIKLQEIADKFSPYSHYEPDLFPGLIFRSISPKLVFLIFRSGKIVITGAKKQHEIKITYDSLYRNIIIHYRDTDGSTSSSSVYRNQIRQQKMLEGVEY